MSSFLLENFRPKMLKSYIGYNTIIASSVRRILKRGGGAKNFRKFERNIDQNLKLPHSNFVPFFAQNQVKSKKKSFVPFFAQSQLISSPKPDAQLAKGGEAMPQFCSLFYAILQFWQPKGGAMAQCPPPPKYAPEYRFEIAKRFLAILGAEGRSFYHPQNDLYTGLIMDISF